MIVESNVTKYCLKYPLLGEKVKQREADIALYSTYDLFYLFRPNLRPPLFAQTTSDLKRNKLLLMNAMLNTVQNLTTIKTKKKSRLSSSKKDLEEQKGYFKSTGPLLCINIRENRLFYHCIKSKQILLGVTKNYS